MTETPKEYYQNIVNTFVIATALGFTIGAHFDHYYIAPTNARLYDMNKDGEIDIFYPEKFPFPARFYLQTKEGDFVLYEEFLKQEKAKIDSIYQVNPEAFKGLLERELEKGVK